ncbi:MAG: two-component regulator propeller domain-containing protein, partial [bacterium]
MVLSRRYVAPVAGLLCLLWLTCHTQFAVAQRGMFQTYKVEDGLCQSQVATVCQDQDGYLWSGTNFGVSRFDGSRFMNFSHANGLAGNFITASLVDSQGRVWFGHLQGGITCYEEGRFQALPGQEAWRGVPINAIAEDAEGRLLFATLGSGLLVCMEGPSGFMIDAVPGSPSDINDLVAGTDAVWLGTAQGLYRADLALPSVDSREWSCRLTLLTIEAEHGEHITRLYEDSRQRIWIGTLAGCISVLAKDRQLHTMTRGIRFTSESDQVLSLPINDIVEDWDGNIWVAQTGQGVFRLKAAGQPVRILEQRQFSIDDGLSYNDVNQMTVDREGNIWFGTGAHLCVYRGAMFETTNFSDDPHASNIWCIHRDGDGTLWFGTEGGLVRYDAPSSSRSRAVTRFYTTADGLRHNSVRDIAEGRDGYLWLVSKGGGLTRFD